MPRTEAQKRARNKYEAAHYSQLKCKVTNDIAEAFKEACSREGTTPHAVLRQAVDDFMAEYGNPVPARKNALDGNMNPPEEPEQT